MLKMRKYTEEDRRIDIREGKKMSYPGLLTDVDTICEWTGQKKPTAEFKEALQAAREILMTYEYQVRSPVFYEDSRLVCFCLVAAANALIQLAEGRSKTRLITETINGVTQTRARVGDEQYAVIHNIAERLLCITSRLQVF